MVMTKFCWQVGEKRNDGVTNGLDNSAQKHLDVRHVETKAQNAQREQNPQHPFAATNH